MDFEIAICESFHNIKALKTKFLLKHAFLNVML